MNPHFDILSDVLDSLHICGNLLLRESYLAPWSISLPHGDKLGTLLDVQPGIRVVAFHLVERGYIEVNANTQDPCQETPLIVQAGEMVICFGGSSHQIFQGQNVDSFPVENVLAGASLPFRCEAVEGDNSLICICGVFYLQDTHLNPLFAALPPILHAPVASGETSANLSGVANLIVHELERRTPGGDFMVERLLELLCAGAIRTYFDQFQAQEPSWIVGLQDPLINRVLSLIHAQPGSIWSVETLAQSVNLSPSRLAARFKETLGESLMNYVAKWRIHTASRLLRKTEGNISEVAAQVGYENLAAFNRAFKRHMDMPPGVWRSLHLKQYSN